MVRDAAVEDLLCVRRSLFLLLMLLALNLLQQPLLDRLLKGNVAGELGTSECGRLLLAHYRGGLLGWRLLHGICFGGAFVQPPFLAADWYRNGGVGDLHSANKKTILFIT